MTKMIQGLNLIIVVAIADNGVIGAKGGLPWKISSDLKRVKELTTGKVLLMGRRTYDSIGFPLPNRKTIVLTSDLKFSVPGVSVYRTFSEALVSACYEAIEMGTNQVIAFGGRSIYANAIPLAQTIYKTEVHCSPIGETYFPEYDNAEWTETERQFFPANDKDESAFSFVQLDRKTER